MPHTAKYSESTTKPSWPRAGRRKSASLPTARDMKWSEETRRALKQRAAKHGRSIEAEIREILEAAVRPSNRVKIGSELAALGKRFGRPDLNITRDSAATEPAVFS